MAKKIQIQFDIDNKDLKIAGEDTLSLVQQLRILKKELQNPNLGQAEFEILRKKIGDVEDGIAKTSVRSRDFFSVLSTLPGPIGGIASSLSGAIDTLKVFSSFSLKDIKNSFTDVIDDVKDVVKGFLGLTDATKKQTAADQQLTTATQGATAATQGQNTATVTLTASERAATIATNALKLALASLGIGLIIIAVTKLVEIVSEWVSGTKAADAANKELEQSFKSLQTSIEETQKAAKERTDAAVLQAKIEGKSSKEVFEIVQRGLNDRVEANKKARLGIEKQQELLLLNTKITEEQRLKLQQDIDQQFVANSNRSIDLRVEGEKLVLEEQLRIAEEGRQKAKEIQTKREQDLKTFYDKLRQLQQENSILTIEDERQRALKQLEIQKQNEELAINQLKISREKRNELLLQLDSNFRIKSQQVNKKFDEDDRKSRQEFLTKINELSISLIQDETKRLTEERKLQFKKEQDALKESDGFKKASKQEQNEALLNLDRKLQIDLTKIQQEGEQKRLDSSAQNALTLTSVLGQLDESFTQDINKRQSYILSLTDTIGAYFGEAGLELEDYVKNIGSATTREQYKIKSFADLIETIYQSNRKKIQENQTELEESLVKTQKSLEDQRSKDLNNLNLSLSNKQITQDQFKQKEIEINDFYNKKLEESNLNYKLREDEINNLYLQNNANYINKQIQLDNLLLDARRQNADATIQVAENVAGLLTAIAGKSIKLQKAAAIADGLVSIARVIIDTQRANVAFTASVAPLGPAGVPLAASYALKNTISAALAIATITAQGISRIKQIDENAANQAGGNTQQSNRLGRGYAEGGLIGGKRHSQGGTIIEAERGEAIMTRGAVTMFAPLLSMMNQMGGGVSFSSNMNTARPDMPVVNNPSTDQPLIVKTYVVENEMTSTQQKQARLKDLSTL